jgi:hypothetical protein
MITAKNMGAPAPADDAPPAETGSVVWIPPAGCAGWTLRAPAATVGAWLVAVGALATGAVVAVTSGRVIAGVATCAAFGFAVVCAVE